MPPPCCLLPVRVIPNASREETVGWQGEELKVKIRAPALEGRANDALCAYLAVVLHLPKRAVSLHRGEKSRRKLVRIEGLSLDEIRRRTV